MRALINIFLSIQYIQMPTVNLSNHHVFWTQIDDHATIKKELMDTVDSVVKSGCLQNPFKNCTMQTTITQSYSLLNREQMNSVVFKPFMRMISEIKDPFIEKLDVNKLCVTTQWFNLYQKGDFQEVHDHLMPDGRVQKMTIGGKHCEELFSAVYIFNDSSSESSIIFRVNGVVFDTSTRDICEGCVLIFPSCLKHEVKPVTSSGRVTFAFNIAYSDQ